MHLFAANLQPGSESLTSVDTFAIDEAHDPAFASGFGDLSVHEVATDLTDWNRAYLSYYMGGIRSLEIQCTNPSVASTCQLAEIGGYLDPDGNNFWGIETFKRDGQTYIAGSVWTTASGSSGGRRKQLTADTGTGWGVARGPSPGRSAAPAPRGLGSPQ